VGGLLTTSYSPIVSLVLSGCQALGVLQLRLEYLPLVIPIVFVGRLRVRRPGALLHGARADHRHMNLPIFLSSCPWVRVCDVFPARAPGLAAISTAKPCITSRRASAAAPR